MPNSTRGASPVPPAKDERNETVRRHADTVWRIALSRTRKEEAAEEVFQEVFMRLFEKERTFDSDEHCKAWLIRTTLICCKRYFAATFKNTTLTLEEVGDLASVPEEEHGLFAALLKLPAKYRIPIQLYYIEQIPAETCAEILELRPGSFRSRLSRGKEMLRELLKGDGIDV
ncbi:MAG: sigma-70 family RNA polymerase sigma factor [Clostridia bacterium]|nr:sigma-70 family RNA polymerase sigma factor [Clostridia bacterium]